MPDEPPLVVPDEPPLLVPDEPPLDVAPDDVAPLEVPDEPPLDVAPDEVAPELEVPGSLVTFAQTTNASTAQVVNDGPWATTRQPAIRPPDA